MDWDRDGKLDILSGSYLSDESPAGLLQFLRGIEGLNFEAATTLVAVDGQPVENVIEKDNPDSVQRRLLNLCTHQHAVDYDDDGDLDLIVGSNMDQFFLRENIGDTNDASGDMPKLAPSSIPILAKLPSPARHAAPHLVDWDSDGDLDLVSGSSLGGVFLCENVGSRSDPEWAAFKTLVRPLSESSAEPAKTFSADDPEIEIGLSTRVWVADYNNDGLLDLIVGDHHELDGQQADGTVRTLSTGFVWVLLRKADESAQVASASAE